MSPLVAVLAAGGALGVAAPLLLGRLGRLDRAPQAAAYLWLAATLGALSAVLLAGLLLLLAGSSRLLGDLAVLLATCSMALRAALDAPTGTPAPTIGLALLGLVGGGLLVGGLLAGARAWRAARGRSAAGLRRRPYRRSRTKPTAREEGSAMLWGWQGGT
jgi:hypothetical protein